MRHFLHIHPAITKPHTDYSRIYEKALLAVKDENSPMKDLQTIPRFSCSCECMFFCTFGLDMLVSRGSM